MSLVRNLQSDPARLLLAKLVLAITLVGMLFVGHGPPAWPLLTWPMYQTAIFDYPGESIARYWLRVIDAEGKEHDVSIDGHFPPGRNDVVKNVIHRALNSSDPARRRAHEAYLAKMLARAMPDEDLAYIEILLVKWKIDLATRPPLDRDAPFEREVLSRFAAGASP